ncbi:MAG: 4Fe-4S ferredoxin [Spirochaetales bacterium]|nr:4Fe-4S ferredoxin [Spirochaetales bacterium]
MALSNEVTGLATSLGATFAGIADITPAKKAIANQAGNAFARYSRAVSIGVALPGAIVDGIINQDNHLAVMSYQHHGYDVINPRLDAIVSRIASEIQDRGYSVFPVAASQTIDPKKQLASFSHKLAARMAGLGWIGKSCLLVTPAVGPRVRWASVLTDAPIEPTGMGGKEQCGSCTECVDICPVGAFSGKPFQEDEPRSVRFDVSRCATHQTELQEKSGFHLCGLCLYVCPHGRKDGE